MPSRLVRRAVFANLAVAVTMVCLIVSGYLALAPDFALSWPIAVGFAAWMTATTGLWWERRWGWWFTVIAATSASLLSMFIGFITVFFHSAPTLRMIADNPEVLAVIGASLVPWVAVATLFHPEVRRLARHALAAQEAGFPPHHARRRLLVLALVAVLPAAWLAWQPVYVHRSMVDGTEPGYTSNYLQGRGLIFPWLVTEVPYDIPISWVDRIFPINLAALYCVAAAPVVLLHLLILAVQARRRPQT